MPKIAVHLHLFYQEQVEDMLDRLKNLSNVPYDLYVTLVSENLEIEQKIRAFKADANVWIVPNVGYDVGPFIDFLHHIDIDSYDYIIKIHTKRTTGEYEVLFNHWRFDMKMWREMMLDSVISRRAVVENMQIFEKFENVGMIGHKYVTTKEYQHYRTVECDAVEQMKKIGLAVPNDKTFVAGTMFWVRAKLLKPFLCYNTTDFVQSQPLVHDCTLAHVLERIFGWGVSAQGYKIFGVQYKMYFWCLLKMQIYHFLFSKKVTKKGYLLVKVCKIPVLRIKTTKGEDMKIWQKIKLQKDGKNIKKYKFCGITILRKEKSLTKKKWNIFGLKFCKSIKKIKVKSMSFFLSKKAPLVSVIVPNYNHGKFLERRLISIYKQSYKNKEIILLDDCSSDNSRQILLKYAQKYPSITKIVFNDQNSGGVFYQWKKGLQLAKGEYVWIAESDDYCEKDFLVKLIPAFEDESVMISYARTEFIKNKKLVWTQEEYLHDINYPWNKSFVETTHNLVNAGFGYKNIIPNVSSAVFRNTGFSDILSQEKWYKMKLCGDWIFYLNVARGGKIAYTALTTNYYRLHDNNTSTSVQKQNLYYKEHEMVGEYIAKNYKITDVILKLKEILEAKWIEDKKYLNKTEFSKFFDLTKINKYKEQRNLNILMVIWAFSSGGGETFPIYLSNQLKKVGINITILDFEGQNREKGVRKLLSKDIPVVSIRSQEFSKIIEDYGIDIVQSQHASVDTYISSLVANHQKTYKHIVVMHGMYETIPDDILISQLPSLQRNVDRWLYISDKNISFFLRNKVYNARKFFKISNGLPSSKINPIDRSTLNIPQNAFVLCEVSRGIFEKGWSEAVEAVKIARNITAKDIHLILVGNGPAYDEMVNNVPDFVHMVGFQQNTRDYFATSDIAILASRFKGESFPLVIIDALFCDKPVIASDIGEVKRMLSDEDKQIAGAIFSLDNWCIPINELANIIGDFAVNQDKYVKAKKIAEKIKVNFRIEKITQEYIKHYMQIS